MNPTESSRLVFRTSGAECPTTDAVTLNECRNDGSFIHLYFDASASVWSAYGLSAYNLYLSMEVQEVYNLLLCGFSKTLQMPCVTVGTEVFPLLSRLGIPLREISGYRLFRMFDAVDMSAYLKWTNRVKKSRTLEMITVGREIPCPESGHVPGGRFIADGMSPFSRAVNRVGDGLLAFCLLAFVAPFIGVCCLAIRCEDGGPVFHRQERIGRRGRSFFLLEFRTMRLDAERFGPESCFRTDEEDPRLTRVGYLLRRCRLEWLPQLWNVLTGDMAFVGPYPERKFHVEQLLEQDSRYVFLYQIRPGMVSPAGVCCNGKMQGDSLYRMERELEYLEHRSCRLDLKVFFRVFRKIVSCPKHRSVHDSSK